MIDFLSKVILPLLTFFAGAFIQSYRTQHSETIAQVNEIINEIEGARDVATDYWMSDEKEGSAAQAVKVRSGLHLISLLASEDVISDTANFDGLLDDFIDLCTGGAFETAERTAESDRAFDVRISAADLITSLRKRRGQVNRASYLFVDSWRGTRRWARRRLDPYVWGKRVGAAYRGLLGRRKG